MSEAERALRGVLRTGRQVEGGAGAAIRFGPIPMSVWGDDSALVAHVQTHAAASEQSAAWRPLTVLLCTSTTLPRSELPAPLLPARWPGPQKLVNVGPLVAYAGEDMVWIVDAESGTAMRWTDRAADVPIWESIRPLRFALRWWAVHHDAALLHAAAVGHRGRGALLVGDAGAGKSTTAFSCLGSELQVLGDDYSLVEAPGPGAPITVHATYRLGNLDESSLRLLPHLRARVIGMGPREKSVLPLDPLPATQSSAAVEAVCAVTQAPGEPTRIVAASAADAIRRLGPSTLSQIPGFAKQTWRVVTGVGRDRPSYELRVGSLPDASAALTRLLADGAR
jgi:hypothetical protein